MAKPFKYRGAGRTVEEVDKAAKKSSGAFDSFLTESAVYYKPRDGENNIRILPPSWEDTKTWGRSWHIDLYLHYELGTESSTYICLDKMNEETCPPCEARSKAKTEELQKALKPRFRPLVYVIDRDNEKAGVQAYPMPLTLFKEINQRSINKKTNTIYQIDNPEEGFDVTFTKEGKGGINTKYTGVSIDVGNPSPLSTNDKKMEKWLDYIMSNPLPDILNFFDEDYLNKILSGKPKAKKGDDEDEPEGEEEEAEGEEEEDDAPRGKRKPARGRRDEEEEEPEAEEEPEEEEEDDPPPRSSRLAGKGRRARDEEEEEPEAEEEPEEEEEDDPPPRGKRGKPGRSARRDEEEEDEPEEEDDPEGDEGEEEEEDEPAPKGKQSVSSKARERLEAMKAKRTKPGKRR